MNNLALSWIFLGTALFVMVAIEAGFRYGRFVHKRSEDEKESPVNAIAGSKRSSARPFLALSFSVVVTLIAALDRPDSPYLKVSQLPLVDLRGQMEDE